MISPKLHHKYYLLQYTRDGLSQYYGRMLPSKSDLLEIKFDGVEAIPGNSIAGLKQDYVIYSGAVVGPSTYSRPFSSTPILSINTTRSFPVFSVRP